MKHLNSTTYGYSSVHSTQNLLFPPFRATKRSNHVGPDATVILDSNVDSASLSIYYLPMTDINTKALDRERKKGSAELLILSLLDARARHGYELSKLIHARSGGTLTFHIDSLYPLLYRLEERAWITGTWVEKAGERRRRFYTLTTEGRRVLARQRKTWETFVEAVRRVTGTEPA